MSNAVAARVSPAMVLRHIGCLCRSAPAIQTPRGDADRDGAAVLQTIEDALLPSKVTVPSFSPARDWNFEESRA
jgi:hypothetical protein